jgi:hypothetical protein
MLRNKMVKIMKASNKNLTCYGGKSLLDKQYDGYLDAFMIGMG